jgi:hypothetical protein
MMSSHFPTAANRAGGVSGLSVKHDALSMSADFTGFGNVSLQQYPRLQQALACALALRISASSCSRSSPLSRTTYFFTEISLAAMIVSIACAATESNHKIFILAN